MIPSWGTCKPTMAASVWIAAIRHAPPMIRRRLQSLGWLKPEIRSPIDIVVRNVKFRAHLSGNTPEHKLVFQGRRLDRWHLSYMRPRLAKGACFVDVGANFGYFTLVAAQILKGRGAILAIEPSPIMVQRLRDNIALNGFEGIQVEACAVGDDHGWASPHSTLVDHGSTGFGTVQAAAMLDVGAVKMMPLLAIVEKSGIEHIDVLKIDIEGFEDRALLPFFASAPRSLWPRMVLLEISSWHLWRSDVCAKLQDIGYDVLAQGRVDIILVLRC